MQKVLAEDLGKIDYQKAWDYQEKIFKEIVDQKITNRNLPPSKQTHPPHRFLICEHPHVYTLGKSGSLDNLLINENDLSVKQAAFYKINRGGDITYHGPGQIVGYPILDLDYFFTDIHKYLRLLEEVIIRTMADFGLKGERLKGATGVWLEPDKSHARKICAMGVRCSRWVTMHGFAFNVNADLSYFGNIIPCGITDKTVTSLDKELGEKLDMEEVRQKIYQYFSELFEVELIFE